MKIKDPIHGYIELDEEEEQLLDTYSLQRLRDIKQLGFADMVYPAANHTRFEHTLGVLSVAQDYAESLDLNDKRTKELRLAALFHDTGHGPWSHLTERITGVNHEEVSCEIVDRHKEDFEADPDRVKKIIRGELEIGRVIHGDVDADRMDYLQRDSYKTGVDHGTIDSDTIIENAEIDSRRLVYDYKAIQSLESLLVARSHMLKSVYWHHTNLIADTMVTKAAKNMAMKFSPSWDDITADQMLSEHGGQLYQRVKNRNLYKRAGSTSLDPAQAKKEVLEQTGLGDEDVLVNRMTHDGDELNPERDNHSLDVKVKYYGEIKNLSEISDIPRAAEVSSLEGEPTKLYADKNNVEEVREAIKNVEN